MAQTKLQQYFPTIRTREQILLEIKSDTTLNRKFQSFSEESRKEFLDFCTGEKGVKVLYDNIFKTVMNPDLYPDRLQNLLSCILGMEIASFRILESSSFALGDEKSLVILDVVVELRDGSIINLEVQKIGYDFPAERAACYASDLTLRQYARAKSEASEKKKTDPTFRFNYRSIHPVYTIVLIEQSSAVFRKFPDVYIHRFSQKSDSGLFMNLLHNYIFIPLDIFKQKHQNNPINTQLEAWLTFLSTDEPEKIIRLCEAHPMFKELYRHIYEICRNTEDIMGIFSEELAEMDRNTVDYMIDRLQKENIQLQNKNMQLQDKNTQLQDENTQLQDEKAKWQKQEKQMQNQISRIQAEYEQLKNSINKNTQLQNDIRNG